MLPDGPATGLGRPGMSPRLKSTLEICLGCEECYSFQLRGLSGADARRGDRLAWAWRGGPMQLVPIANFDSNLESSMAVSFECSTLDCGAFFLADRRSTLDASSLDGRCILDGRDGSIGDACTLSRIDARGALDGCDGRQCLYPQLYPR